MIDQQPQQPGQISSDDLHRASGAQFGLIIGRLTVENLELGKRLISVQAHIAQSQADQAELERQNAQLTAGAVAYEDRIDELEKELAKLKNIGPAAATIADQGDGIIQETRFQPLEPMGTRIKEAARMDGSG